MSAHDDTWSVTRLRTWHRCARLHHYRYDLGIGEPPTDLATFGTVGHSALEGYLHGETPSVALADPFETARLTALLDGYRYRWQATAWEILGVELPFSFGLADHVVTGRMDALVRDRTDGRVYVVEHKFTTSDTSPGAAYWDRLALDLQVGVYLDAARVLGFDPAGMIYDVIAKPGHKPRKATPLASRKYTKATATEPSRLYAGHRDSDETPIEFRDRIREDIANDPNGYYQRAILVRTDDELPRMRSDILDTIRLARVALEFDAHPRNSDACSRYGSRCFFWEACTGSASIDDEIRFPRLPSRNATVTTQAA